MPPLLTLSYWFNPNPVPFQSTVDRALLIAFAVLFVAGLIVWMFRLKGGISKEMKKAFSRIANHLSWTGIAGLLLWVMSYERIPWFSIRVMFILWAIWFVLGLWFVFRYVWVEVPAQQARRQERAAQQKWLPKRKK